jgi:nucleoside-diphosphate-sugar epimerase|tara:strand:- start:162 stop:1115 length:954 start_codon:yes stop_codon:yes gene_type:complete
VKKNILICGASGFIGKNLVLYFAGKKKYNLIGTYHKKKSTNNLKNIKWIKTDLRNFDQCIKVTKNMDIVMQCAATTSGSRDIIRAPYLHVTDNAVMNSYLLRASYINKVKHFIFTSCTVMYKNSNKPLTEKEVDEKKIFKNYYGVGHTKLYIEKMCKFFSKISDIKFTVIRHSNIYGPFDKFDKKKGHFIGSSIYRVFNEKTKKINIFGMGNEMRDYLYVNDLLSFIDLAIKKQKENFQIFNCSYGKSFKIKEILQIILKISGSNKKIENISSEKNINVNILVNSNKAKNILRWKPKTTIHKGIKLTIDWFKKKYLK